MIEEVDGYLCELRRADEGILQPILKVGGVPVFLEESIWPVCTRCGQAMNFIAQIPLQRPLRFSHKYAIAYVFMCPGSYDDRGWLLCNTWASGEGANAVFLQEDRGRVIVADAKVAYPDCAVTLRPIKELLIDTSDYDLPDGLRERVSEATKIGGVPAWLQGNGTPKCPRCKGSTILVAQINAELDGALPADPSRWGDAYQFLDFGDVGLGYVFICANECGRDGAAFLWQST
ncbi:MAG: hypothetical protein U0822_05390 [Anaerolineae bacterium]